MVGPHPVDQRVGARIRMRRKERGVSQETLANQLGLTFQQVQKYERGANRISASKLFEVATFLGVSPNYFFEGLDLATDPTDTDEPVVQAFALTEGGRRLILAGSFLNLSELGLLATLAETIAHGRPA